MKKLIAVVLAVLTLLTLGACSAGKSVAPAVEAPVSTVEPAKEASVTEEPATTPEPSPVPKSTIAIAELAEGTYTGTLSGDSYSGTYDDSTYSISPEISPAEISVAIKDGQVKLYCAAGAVASGTVFDVEAPNSPTYTQTVSGSLALHQIDEDTIRAEGDITSPSESIYIYWDGNKKFDRWEIIVKDNTHHCTVSISRIDGVPVAEIAVDGKSSHRTATMPLALRDETVGERPVSPYAWLGYEELPQCNYFDIVATGVFYREYDSHISGYSVPTVQASDGVNTYRFDGSNILLNLNGMVYSLGVRGKQYMEKDMTATYQSTLATQNENRINGVDATGKEFVGTGNEPVPLLSESGDAASYDYYEFTSEQMGMTLRERIYFKDGDVYAIHQLVSMGENKTELTEVITLISASPDPALFALPADFDQYTPIG